MIERLYKVISKLLTSADLSNLSEVTGVPVPVIRGLLLYPDDAGSSFSLFQVRKVAISLGIPDDEFLSYFDDKGCKPALGVVQFVLRSADDGTGVQETDCGWTVADLASPDADKLYCTDALQDIAGAFGVSMRKLVSELVMRSE